MEYFGLFLRGEGAATSDAYLYSRSSTVSQIFRGKNRASNKLDRKKLGPTRGDSSIFIASISFVVLCEVIGLAATLSFFPLGWEKKWDQFPQVHSWLRPAYKLGQREREKHVLDRHRDPRFSSTDRCNVCYGDRTVISRRLCAWELSLKRFLGAYRLIEVSGVDMTTYDHWDVHTKARLLHMHLRSHLPSPLLYY